MKTKTGTTTKIAVHQAVLFIIGLICSLLVITTFSLGISSSLAGIFKMAVIAPGSPCVGSESNEAGSSSYNTDLVYYYSTWVSLLKSSYGATPSTIKYFDIYNKSTASCKGVGAEYSNTDICVLKKPFSAATSTDSCAADNDCYLKEYYVAWQNLNSPIGSAFYKCPNDCSDGACTQIKKIAVIITKAPGSTSPSLPYLQQHLEHAKQQVLEDSYGQVSLRWDVFGPYEATGDTSSFWLAADPFVDFRNYSLILSIDSRALSYGSAVRGLKEKNTNDGVVHLGFTFFQLGPFQVDTGWTTLVHELGHSFGALEADFYKCKNNLPISLPTNCSDIIFGDFVDVQGTGPGHVYGGHHNAFYKEIFGWLGDNRSQIITQSGTATIYAYEKKQWPVVLKIPRKKDESGKITEYYYLEYRTPTGFDSFISQVQTGNNGPQIRIADSFNGSSYLINMNPAVWQKDAGISVGQTFTDPVTGVSIKTLSADSEKATVAITLSNQSCVRNNPTINIKPLSLTAKKSEQLFIDFDIINNDSGICSDRILTPQFGSATVPLSSAYSSPYNLGSKDIKNEYAVSYNLNFSPGSYTIPLKISDQDRGILINKNIPLTVIDNFSVPLFSNQDIARSFTYTPAGDGYYLMDKNGKFYRFGNTSFTTDNSQVLNNAKSFDVSHLGLNDSADMFLAIDSQGSISHAGANRQEVFLSRYDSMPKPNNNYVSDMKIASWEKYLLILYSDGQVWASNGQSANYTTPCQGTNGRTDLYRPGVDHTRKMEIFKYANATGQMAGYYVLSKDGTIYLCGDGNMDFTRYNQTLPANFGTGNRYAVSFTLDPVKGFAVLDSYGKVYTTGSLIHQGNKDMGKDLARDIKLLPNQSGYGILFGDGSLYECKNSSCVIKN